MRVDWKFVLLAAFAGIIGGIAYDIMRQYGYGVQKIVKGH